MFSRVLDMYLWYLHLPGLAQGIALFTACMTGGIMRMGKTRIGLALAALTCWLLLTLPFSWWRGGSVPLIAGGWLKGMAAFAMASALIVTARQCRLALFSLGIAGGAGAVLLYFKGQMLEGRLSLSQGRFRNANDAAMLLLVCLPCLYLILADKRVSAFVKGPVVGLILILLAAVAKTGSRAGMIGFLALCLIAFFQASAAGKAKMALAGVLALAAFFTVVPHSLQDRYTTFFKSSEPDNLSMDEREFLNAATASSEERLTALKDAIKITLQRPVFGIGPGNFAPYEAHLDEEAGKKFSVWIGTHNTYAQYACETGIPGLILYLTVLTFCIKDLGKISRRAKKIQGLPAETLVNAALVLRASLIAFAACTFFEHVGYEMLIPTLTGLATAIVTAGELELNALERGALAAPAIPVFEPVLMRHRVAAGSRS